MTSLAETISSVARDLPGEYVDRLANHLMDVPGPTAVGLMQAGDLVAVPAFRAAVESLWKAWASAPDMPGSTLSLALLAATSAVADERSAQSVTAVVTGPSSWHVPVRQTSAVMLDLIQRAQKSLFLSSFAAYKVPELVAALKAAVSRGVAVTLLLETVEDSGGALSHDAKTAFTGVSALRLLVWPADMRPDLGPGKASMHAKVVICDRSAAFVTSANLTGSALERNLEVGVLVSGGAMPGRLLDHFTELQAKGFLRIMES
jgi:cardiolipin synthase